jgi:membrane-bound lytic murein transglycosylase D
LDFNPIVKRYIKAYAIDNAEKISRILGEMQYFFPVFENYLNRYNLPPELKYLAAVESALDPNAVSKSGAVGLWQFLPGTAGLFDLEINAWVDERRDIYKSTDAACKYLEYLYRLYDDWHLVLASYNGGPGAVKKAIARANGQTNYWEISPFITTEMQNYVPAFIAMNYVIAYHEDFGIKPAIPLFSYFETDTIMVYKQLDFDKISNILPIEKEQIQYLNPIYRKSIIPSSEKSMPLVLPVNLLIDFIINIEEIYNTDIENDTEPINNILEKQKIIVDIVSGDSFHKLAIRYKCTIDDILRWNNLSEGHLLKVGEKMIIYQ